MPGPAVRDLDLDLDAFEGPFDLLLTLVLKEELELAEVEIADVVLAFVSRQRCCAFSAGDVGRLASLASTEEADADGDPLDLDACGEFLVLVASLLELKARELLGADEIDLDGLEPDEAAEELAERLAVYRSFKAAAGWLEERLEAEGHRYFRLGPAPLGPVPVRALDPHDPVLLVAALRALAAEPPEPSLRHLVLTYPPVSLFLERFRALLARRPRFDFDEEVGALSRMEQAVAFLALLELRKAGEILLGQPAPFAPITAWTARSA